MRVQVEEESKAKAEAKEKCNSAERRCAVATAEAEDARGSLDAAERARKAAEKDVSDANDRVNELAAQNSSISGQKRKLEGDVAAMQSDLDDMSNDIAASEERAKKAMADAANLATELRYEQEKSSAADKAKKNVEVQLKDLQLKLEEAEANVLKGGKKLIASLETKVSYYHYDATKTSNVLEILMYLSIHPICAFINYSNLNHNLDLWSI